MILTILLIITYILPMVYCGARLSYLTYVDYKRGINPDPRVSLFCAVLTICPLLNVYTAGKLLEGIHDD